MNAILSDRINNLSTSQTLAMAALARELKAQGKDIISLSLGEPDFNTPDFIKEAEQEINDFFGQKVEFKLSGNNKGKLVIPFHSKEDFLRIKKLLK